MDILLHITLRSPLTDERKLEIERALLSEFDSVILRSEKRMSRITNDRLIVMLYVEEYSQPEFDDYLEQIEDEFDISIVMLSKE